MIAHLSGTLIQKQPNSVIIDVGGVGYELIVPLSTFYELPETGAAVALRAFTYVREDALQLYGFSSEGEKKLFLLLTSVSGIGPKLAITLLSGLSAEDIVQSIRQNNLARLVSVPGVGKKTAERLVVELKDKVTSATISAAIASTAVGAGATHSSDLRDDVVSALVNLGYQRPPAERAVNEALKDEPSATFEVALKRSLRTLSR
jgi:Holliday junction DNA helicase RuvA